MDTTRISSGVFGSLCVLAGGHVVLSFLDSTGNLGPPLLALGVLLLLFGAALVATGIQTRYARRRLVEYELLAGATGLFTISAYVTVLTIGWKSPLGRFFGMLGAATMVGSAVLVLVVAYARR